MRQLERDRADPGDRAEEQPGDERAASCAEAQVPAARKRDGDLADGEADGDADGESVRDNSGLSDVPVRASANQRMRRDVRLWFRLF